MRFSAEDEPDFDGSDKSNAPAAVSHKRLRTETKALYRKADALFAAFSCPGTAECCQLATTRKEPWLWPSEWLVLLESLQQNGRVLPLAREDGGCRFLNAEASRCTVYKDRPLGCRTFFCHRIQGPQSQPTQALDALMKKLGDVNLECKDDAAPKPMSWWVSEHSLKFP